MIDTIAVTVMAPGFTVRAPGMFGPKQTFPDGGWKRCQHSTPKERAANIKRPALTLAGGGPGRSEERLRIEVSLPKLVFGDNLSELADGDAGLVLELLSNAIADMGVDLDEDALWMSKVSRLDVGKNILLPPGMSCPTAIRELRSHPQRATWEEMQERFCNGGHGFRLHTNTREIAFYDKLSDIRKAMWSPKRAEDPLSRALGMPPTVGSRKAVQVLRMEYRMITRPEVRAALERVGIPAPDPRFRDVFCEDVAMKLLLHELGRFEGPVAGGAGEEHDLMDVFTTILESGETLGSGLKAVGLRHLEAVFGSAALRRECEARGVSDDAWGRLRELRAKVPGGSTEGVVQLIRASALSYTPFRLPPEEGK